jgi:SAM-dependent methyltransferase
VLKQYLPASPSGSTAAFWEGNWSDQAAASREALRRGDPLLPHFLEGTEAKARVLEGGCGLGHYVQVLRESGRRAVGLDFALQTLARVRRGDAELPLAGGDVSALPFRDGSLDAYISQGVVEHFEGGPQPALREAARVLRPGGLLLISVPDFNPLRSLLLAGRAGRRGPAGGHWLRVREHVPQAPPRPGLTFFQYLYRPAEFRALLQGAGFAVEWDRGYSLLWGLQDLGVFRWAFARLMATAAASPSPPAAPVVAGETAPDRPLAASSSGVKDGLRRLFAREQAAAPPSRLFLSVLRGTCANMRLYAARRAPA